jgi:hypothetical protein
MRNFLGTIVMMSAVAATTFAANASSTEKRFEVPFNFTVAGQNWPAGTYLLDKNGTTYSAHLQSMDAKKNLALTLSPGDPAPTDTRAILTFVEDKQNHELKSVQYGSMVGSLHASHNRQSEQRTIRTVQGQ